MCLGQRLAAGSVDMWKISPLFQGVGIALLTAQAFIGIYSIVGVSWMFVYFRYVASVLLSRDCDSGKVSPALRDVRQTLEEFLLPLQGFVYNEAGQVPVGGTVFLVQRGQACAEY